MDPERKGEEWSDFGGGDLVDDVLAELLDRPGSGYRRVFRIVDIHGSVLWDHLMGQVEAIAATSYWIGLYLAVCV